MIRKRPAGMLAEEYRAAIEQLDLTQLRAAEFLGLSPRQSRRYALGERTVPKAETMLLRLMIARKLPPAKVLEICGLQDG